MGQCPFLAHRDLASRIHFRNGAESGQIRTDANDPKLTLETTLLHRDSTLILLSLTLVRAAPNTELLLLQSCWCCAMSYDLMVFEPSEAPRERNAFLDWYRFQTQWSEGPATMTAGLSAWFAEMRRDFPSINGPGAYDIANDDELMSRAASYGIGRSVIYACFSWTKAESAYSLVRALAVKHRVGFFNLSAENGEIWFPPTEHAPDTTAIPGLT